MAACWSCTVIVEPGVKICPFCGADQTKPVAFVNPYIPPPRTLKSSFQDWARPLIVIVVALCILAGIYWHNFGHPLVSPASRATAVTAKSLREIREVLSAYSLAAKDSYPAALNSLGDRVNLPTQSALGAGYRLEYIPNAPSGGGAPRGFVILARPEKNTYPNLYIDESGVVRATPENRPATAKDSPL